MFFSEAIALIEPKLFINHWKVLYKLCVFYVDRNVSKSIKFHVFYYTSRVNSRIWVELTSDPLSKPEALKSLYRSPDYKKKQLVLCKNYVLQW
jgi:hypothetical protein